MGRGTGHSSKRKPSAIWIQADEIRFGSRVLLLASYTNKTCYHLFFLLALIAVRPRAAHVPCAIFVILQATGQCYHLHFTEDSEARVPNLRDPPLDWRFKSNALASPPTFALSAETSGGHIPCHSLLESWHNEGHPPLCKGASSGQPLWLSSAGRGCGRACSFLVEISGDQGIRGF